ncbi:MAG: hypothetical protein ACP5HU_02165 [Phycisphaerae bacterium]
MRQIRLMCCLVLAVVFTAAVAGGGEMDSEQSGMSRAGIVRAMLDRSRLLEDVHFTIPVNLWEVYLRETSAPAVAAPVPTVAAGSVYALEMPDDGPAGLTATIHYQVLDPSAAGSVPVLSAEHAWRDVRVNGEPTEMPVIDGWLSLLCEEPGEYVVTARMQPDWQTGTSENTLSLPVPATTTTVVTLDSPEAWVLSAAGAVGTIRGSAEAGTHGRVALPTSDQLNITIHPPRPEAYHAPRYAVSGDIVWLLDAGGRRLTARLDVKVLTGRTDRLEVFLPAGAAQVSITGPDVREVRTTGSSAAVFLQGELSEQTRLHVSCEVGGSQDAFRLGELGLRNGHFSGGTVVVGSSTGTSEVLAGRTTGLEPLAVSEIPASAAGMLAGPVALAYRVTGRSWSAGIEVIDLSEAEIRESLADLAHYQAVLTGDGTVFCKVDYELRNRTRQFMRLDLPEGAELVMVRVNERTVPVTPLDDGGWQVPLVRSTASVRGLVSFPVELVCLWRHEPVEGAAGFEVPLPRIDLPIAYAWCELYMPQTAKVRRWAGPLEQVDRFSSETAVAGLTYGSGELADDSAAVPRPGMQPTLPETTLPSSSAEPVEKPAEVRYRLGVNYYRAGRDFYEQGEYDKAAEALRNAQRLNPEGSPAWTNASRLLGNIELMRGELGVETDTEKVAAARVQSEVEAKVADLSARQQSLLEEGLEAARAGRSGEAQVKLRAVEEMGVQLSMSGGGGFQAEQHARMSRARGELERFEDYEQREAAELRKELESLRQSGRYDEAIQAARRLRKYEPDSGGADRPADRIEFELAAEAAKSAPAAAPAPSTLPQKPVVGTYDVRGLVREGGGDELLQAVRDVSHGEVSFTDGKLEVRDTPAGQHRVAELIGNLRELSGPRVQIGSNIVQQQAEGVLQADGSVGADGGDAVSADDLSGQFDTFYSRNYRWAEGDRGVSVAGTDYRDFVLSNARYNLGQKLLVGSTTLNLTAADAAGVGAEFRQGRGGLTFAVVDEAQMRTLLELDARRNGRAGDETRSRRQEAIVGTDALLANGMLANVAFAGDEYNEFIVADNSLRLEHDEYLLVADGGTLTLVGSGEMRHWSETVEQEVFAEVPQTIDAPRVGRMVGFEKSLVRPEDELVLQAQDIVWKGTQP